MIPAKLAAQLEVTALAIPLQEPPLSAYGSAPEFRCAGCNAAPLGGFAACQPLDFVIAKSVEIGSAVWAHIDGSLRVFCGENCMHYHDSEARRGNRPHAVRLDVRVPATSHGPPQTVPAGVHGQHIAFETRVVRSVCSKCGTTVATDQRRLEGGEWQPDERRLLDHANWQFTPGGARYCSRWCLAKSNEDGSTVRTPVAVLAVDDAAYQTARPPPRGPLATAGMSSREVTGGKPQKRVSR